MLEDRQKLLESIYVHIWIFLWENDLYSHVQIFAVFLPISVLKYCDERQLSVVKFLSSILHLHVYTKFTAYSTINISTWLNFKILFPFRNSATRFFFEKSCYNRRFPSLGAVTLFFAKAARLGALSTCCAVWLDSRGSTLIITCQFLWI
jgi:hypothetical protein